MYAKSGYHRLDPEAASPPSALDALAELERRFNGPVPEPLRLAAQLGTAELCRRRHAEAEAAYLKTLLCGQIRLIRRRRAEGSFYPALLDDLRLYRRRWRHWRRHAALPRASVPSAAGSPTAMAAE
jgi:hypothetical protein